MTDSGDPSQSELDGSENRKCPHCKGRCSDATECGMNMIANPDVETPYYEQSGGESSSTPKTNSDDSDSENEFQQSEQLSKGGVEPPKPDTSLFWCPYCESYFVDEDTYYAHGCFFENDIPDEGIRDLFSAETIQEVLDGFRDQIYEEENNATGMQEVAAIEIIRKLEEVFSGDD